MQAVYVTLYRNMAIYKKKKTLYEGKAMIRVQKNICCLEGNSSQLTRCPGGIFCLQRSRLRCYLDRVQKSFDEKAMGLDRKYK